MQLALECFDHGDVTRPSALPLVEPERNNGKTRDTARCVTRTPAGVDGPSRMPRDGASSTFNVYPSQK